MRPFLECSSAVAILHERLAALTMLGGMLIIGAAVYFSLYPHES